MSYFGVILSFFFVTVFGLSVVAGGNSTIDGYWVAEDSGKIIRVTEFNGHINFATRSYYDNGAIADYFFSFRLDSRQSLSSGHVFKGVLRSVDGLYNCVFEQEAKMMVDENGHLRLHFPLLTFARQYVEAGHRTRWYDQYYSSYWDGWSWVEEYYTHCGYPVIWELVSSQCVIRQTNWVTTVLKPY